MSRSSKSFSVVWPLVIRQVVQYVGYVDCYDYQDGHGTHVAGSAAGAMSDTSAGEHLGDGVSSDGRMRSRLRIRRYHRLL